MAQIVAGSVTPPQTATASAWGKNYLFYINKEKDNTLWYWKFTNDSDDYTPNNTGLRSDGSYINVASGGIAAVTIGFSGGQDSTAIRVYFVGADLKLKEYCLDKESGQWYSGNLTKKGYVTKPGSIVSAVSNPRLMIVFHRKGFEEFYYGAVADHWDPMELQGFNPIP